MRTSRAMYVAASRVRTSKVARPQVHFTAQTGWINDPHGLTWRDGSYHLFHQYVPDSQVWAPHCHWGHASSADLLHWRPRPIALAPGEGDDGIWTGSLVDLEGGPTIFYTAVRQPEIGIGSVRIAHAQDSALDDWSKGAVVVEAPDDLIAFRDPFLLREGDGWRMFVGAGLADGTAQALTWTSSDGLVWNDDGVALERSTNEREPWMGALWECPQFVDLGSAWAMVSSIWDDDVLHHAGYAVGSYADGRFEAERWGQLSFGPSYYAPTVFRDRDDNPCLMFWMRGVGDPDAGWSSALSLPWLAVFSDGDLHVALHPEVLHATSPEPLTSWASGEPLLVEWEPHDGALLHLHSEQDMAATLAAIDGGLELTVEGQSWVAPWDGGSVTIVLDGPVLEVLSAGRLLGTPIKPVAKIAAQHFTVRSITSRQETS